MINNKLLLAAGVATLSASFFSSSALAANANGSATVLILEPLSVTAGTNDMNFGDVAGDADNVTSVQLSTGGIATASALANASGSPTAGDFDVAGEGSLAYNITLPASATLAGPGSPATDMTVNAFQDSKNGSSSLTLGTDSFTVGATLNLNAGQGAGTYTGTYSVTVEYQ